MSSADPRASIRGVMSLLLTPFNADGSIDWPAYDAYVDWQVSKHPDGLFAVCGSSEMKWLEADERVELARRAVRSAGNLPVVATANLEPDLSRHREELMRMIDTGISGVVLVPPQELASDPDRLEAYFGELAAASPIPVFLYEWPSVKPCHLPAESFGRLVRERGVAGIKDTTCTLEGITAKIRCAPGAVVFQANTPFAVDAIKAGAGGVMAITSTCCTDLVVALWKNINSGANDEEVASFHRELVFLDAVLGRSHPAGAKYLVSRRGVPFGLYTRASSTLRPQDLKALDVWLSASVKALGLS